MIMKNGESPEITKEQLIYISRQFANMFGFPVRLYHNKETVFSNLPFSEVIDPINLCLKSIIEKNNEIDYYIYNSFLFYGIVNCGEYKFVAGPVSEIKMPENEMKKFCFILNLSSDETSAFASEMNALSGVHLDTLLQSMILYNFSVNRTLHNISDIRIKDTEQNDITVKIKESEIEPDLNNRLGTNHLKSYFIDKEIVKKISEGDVDGLIDGATKIPAVSSGNLAPHLLRHHKNFFIKLETMSARAAIDAGLDVEEILTIEEMYIRKCESLENIDRIKNLQYHMIIDYADRVKKQRQYNIRNVKMINEISKYIRNHISEPIKTSDIADFLGKSRGGLTTEFKKQSGMNLSDFIKLKKIQEARELLYSTNKSISMISNYLGFSSQSHFTRAFKEITGITPKEYRENN